MSHRRRFITALTAFLDDLFCSHQRSVMEYGFPLPTDPIDLIEIGQRLADCSPRIPKEELRTVGPFLASLSPASHIGPFLHAIDFLVPDGADVLASADGVITAIDDSHTLWGNRSFAKHLNYITLKHVRGDVTEYSQYCHLENGSCTARKMRIGDSVKKGEVIAKVGKTGWTDRDHLHFIVFKSADTQEGFESLIPRFR